MDEADGAMLSGDLSRHCSEPCRANESDNRQGLEDVKDVGDTGERTRRTSGTVTFYSQLSKYKVTRSPSTSECY